MALILPIRRLSDQQPAQRGSEHIDRDELTAAVDSETWADLDIPPEPQLLGDLITPSSRVFIVGGTGLGKTQIAHAIAAGIASGSGFLHWRSERSARCLIVDGEMSKALIKERIQAARRRAPSIPQGNLAVYSLDRSEEFARQFPSLGQFEPLNTSGGQEFMYRLLGAIKPEVVIFDNVMSLIVGDQKDEVPWSETLPLVARITSRGIGQIWLDHTGHDRSRQYGSATKAWRFDAVGIMSTVTDEEQRPGEVAFLLSFDAPGKARRRSPENWSDFAPHVIRLADDRWSSEPAGPDGKRKDETAVPRWIKSWHDALVNALRSSATPGVATMNEWFAGGVQLGLAEQPAEDDTRTIRDNKKSAFRKARAALVSAGWIGVNSDDVRTLRLDPMVEKHVRDSNLPREGCRE